LNESWGSHVLGIAELENKVAASDVVTARKAELTKAVTKSTGAKPAVTTKSAPTAKSTAAPEKPNPEGLLFETSAGPIAKGNPSEEAEESEETVSAEEDGA